MIQANELRIGNYVYTPKVDVRQVSGVTQTQIHTLITGCSFSEIHFVQMEIDPIPLTEEWLLKFGFERNEELVHEMHPWIDYTLKGIRIQMPFFTFNFGDEDEQDIDVHHVHQLQNLYFALTGTELTLKP